MTRGTIGLLAIILILALPTTSSGTQDEELSSGETHAALPFHLPTPEGWGTETIPFPLGFAPDLGYEGLEELRFAPGMFEAGAEDFWSYAFVWWIRVDARPGADQLAEDLEAYYRGLSTAVAADRGHDTTEAEFGASLEAAPEGSGVDLIGKAWTLDAFVTGEQIELGVRIRYLECEGEDHRAIFFELSPRAFDHEVWGVLAEIREGFRCPDSAASE